MQHNSLDSMPSTRQQCHSTPLRRRWAGGATQTFLAGLLAGAVLCTAAAQSFVAEWAETDIGRLGPTGMAVDAVDGRSVLYVSDQIHGRIIRFDLQQGRRDAVWGEAGFGDGEFNGPYGIAVDPVSHDLYVAERTNQRIQRITRTGTHVLKWGVLGTGIGEFNSPVGVAADASGNVYVTDHGNHRVQKFRVQQVGGQWQVEHVLTWGREGSGPGEFNGPFGITLDAAGNLWVADSYNHRLQRFDPNGQFLGQAGRFGRGDGEFVTPTWVTFAPDGSYYVAETNSDPADATAHDIAHQRIQKFDASGAFVSKWGSLGEAGGQFRLPMQLVLDDAGFVYVSDYYNTRLQKFTLAAPPTPPPTTPPPTTPPPTAASDARFVNLSSRLATAEGNAARAFIAGFVIAGTTPKQVLVRAIGPALSNFGVNGVLGNPRLQIYSGTQLLAENDNWSASGGMVTTAAAVGAFALPSGSQDAALLVTLPPGAYSAHVVANGGAGVALVELYDTAAATAASQLVNLSTRGWVGTGDGVLVAGFVVSGENAKRVLVRGVGPALGAFGVGDAIADPVVQVFAGTQIVAANDNWGTPQSVGGVAAATAAELQAAAGAAGAFALPAGSRDAAIIVALPPGAYSAVVSGTSGVSGAGLVEVYELSGP